MLLKALSMQAQTCNMLREWGKAGAEGYGGIAGFPDGDFTVQWQGTRLGLSPRGGQCGRICLLAAASAFERSRWRRGRFASAKIMAAGFERAVLATWRLGVKIENAVMTENAIAKDIVDAAFRIHTTLGPGLLESVYDTVLAYDLDRRGLRTVRQQPIPVIYENVRIDTGFRAGLIVEDKVIVEVKPVELLAPVHKANMGSICEHGP